MRLDEGWQRGHLHAGRKHHRRHVGGRVDRAGDQSVHVLPQSHLREQRVDWLRPVAERHLHAERKRRRAGRLSRVAGGPAARAVEERVGSTCGLVERKLKVWKAMLRGRTSQESVRVGAARQQVLFLEEGGLQLLCVGVEQVEALVLNDSVERRARGRVGRQVGLRVLLAGGFRVGVRDGDGSVGERRRRHRRRAQRVVQQLHLDVLLLRHLLLLHAIRSRLLPSHRQLILGYRADMRTIQVRASRARARAQTPTNTNKQAQ